MDKTGFELLGNRVLELAAAFQDFAVFLGEHAEEICDANLPGDSSPMSLEKLDRALMIWAERHRKMEDDVLDGSSE